MQVCIDIYIEICMYTSMTPCMHEQAVDYEYVIVCDDSEYVRETSTDTYIYICIYIDLYQFMRTSITTFYFSSKQAVEYKYVIVRDDGEYVWETSIDNRMFTAEGAVLHLDDGHFNVEVVCLWGWGGGCVCVIVCGCAYVLHPDKCMFTSEGAVLHLDDDHWKALCCTLMTTI